MCKDTLNFEPYYIDADIPMRKPFQQTITLEDSLNLPEQQIKDIRSLTREDKNIYGGTNTGVSL